MDKSEVNVKMLVCIKQVIDSAAVIDIADDGRSVLGDDVGWSLSPYDEYAVELALTLKDAHPDTTVDVVSIGPARATTALRQTLAMGCDSATLVDGDPALSPPTVASALAAFQRDGSFDVILCGKQAGDDETGLVGPGLAHLLGWPHLGSVSRLERAAEHLLVWREVERGHDVWEARAPLVLSVHRSPSEPRYPSLPNILKAKKAEISVRKPTSFSGSHLAEDPSSAEVVALTLPEARSTGVIRTFDGGQDDVVREVVRLLQDKVRSL